MAKKGARTREELKRYLDERAMTLRRHCLEMIGRAKSGHPGGSLSAADVVAVLYFHHLKHDPKNPKKPDRDRFVLSKGHAAPVLYAALAEAGYFPVADLKTLRQLKSNLEGHPDMNRVPGVEITSGSLGQGLSAGNGMALAGRIDGLPYNVYVLLGDGEVQEGMVWEAAMFGAHHNLDRVTAIIDYNNLQIDGFVSDILEVQPLAAKWEAFGWRVFEVDGHDTLAIADALNQADAVTGQPSVIIARTIKCKGVSFMENKVDFHGKAPNEDELERGLEELTCVVEVEE
ncbi:MAG: transketolase [Actinomycetota bacterium]